MTSIQEWIRKRVHEDERLYQQHGKPLEAEHKGEYVAIGPTGELILGKDDVAVLRQAIARFGSGNFAFRRVGYKAIGKWRRPL